MNVSEAGEYKIVLIDDDPDEAELLREVISESNLPLTLYHYPSYSAFRNALTSASVPNIILADVNLPLISGIEIISYIKNDVELARVPIVTFSNGNADRYSADSLNAGALEFITKPTSLVEYSKIVQHLFELCNKPNADSNKSLAVAC
jgi:DNA-binding response OmpR family regulator